MLTVRPLDGPFGARITGLDPAAITDEDKALIWSAYRERHGLLCFSFDELLEADELHALTAVFGDNELAPGLINGIGKRARPGEKDRTVEEQVADLRASGRDPYLAFIGNADPSTLARRDADPTFFGEWEWHTDMSYIAVPPTFSLLHARAIPADGGDTGFCSQVMAARALPNDLVARLRTVRIKHDSTYGSSGRLRPGMTPPDTPIDALGEVHPALRVVPTTGQEALFLGRRTNAYVVGETLEESEALLDTVWDHATRPEFCYRHRWEVGEVVVWDNRMMLHMRHPVDVDQVRLMWRTQTKGEAVIAATAS